MVVVKDILHEAKVLFFHGRFPVEGTSWELEAFHSVLAAAVRILEIAG